MSKVATALSLAFVAQCFNDGCECRGLLTAAREVKMRPGEGRTPVGYTRKLPAANIGDDAVFRYEREAAAGPYIGSKIDLSSQVLLVPRTDMLVERPLRARSGQSRVRNRAMGGYRRIVELNRHHR